MSNQKIALVTGAYRGLGLETVRQLASQGYTVILTGRKDEKGQAAIEKLAAEGLTVHYQHLDVNSVENIQEAAQAIGEKFGHIDALVNNAAIHYDSQQNALNADFKIVHEAITTNLLAPWHIIRAFVPLLEKAEHATITNISSGAGSLYDMSGGTPAYSVTKAGLNVLTIKFAEELEPKGILVNSVCPGWVRTDMGGQAAPRSVEEGAKGIVWAATLPKGGETGGFFRDGERIKW
ncbi:MAG: SDR family oxidoreductase [Saprospiraceae bacterium]